MNNKLVVLGLLVAAGLSAALLVYNQPPGDRPQNFGSSLKLSEAVNGQRFKLTKGQRQKLKDQGFFLTGSDAKSLFEIYEKNRSNGIPNFITTDTVLHTAHLLYNYSLKTLEYRALYGDVVELTDVMVKASKRQLDELEGGELEKAARRNLAFFSVAKVLLSPEWSPPKKVEGKVKKELKLINRNTEAGIGVSPVMGYKLSYPAFLPKGHYTKSEDLKRYFKAINWYGLANLRLKPGKSSRAIEEGRSETLSALLLAKALNSNRSALNQWQDLERRLRKFAGPPDNLQPDSYLKLAGEVFGAELEFQELTQEDNLDEFIGEALEKSPPSTLPLWAAEKRVSRERAQAFSFLSKRYDLSANIFQNLVYPSVGTESKPRNLPTGLDVMAALGSPPALDILRNRGAFDYENYARELKELRRKIDEGNLTKIDPYDPSLKLEWLNILERLVTDQVVSKETSLGSGWNLKQLNTALGSWTELKHDTVLYAKKSRAMARGVVTMTKGYVEPRPGVYGSIADFADRLKNAEALPEDLRMTLDDFSGLVSSLEVIAEKELAGGKLTEKDYERIFVAARKLEKLASVPAYLQEKEDRAESITRMALAVDVHEDSQRNLVLQEATGNPLSVVALVEAGDEVKLVKGGTYSYYEFKRSTSEVLTDEKWVEVLAGSEAPSYPGWFGSSILVEDGSSS